MGPGFEIGLNFEPLQIVDIAQTALEGEGGFGFGSGANLDSFEIQSIFAGG